MPHAEQLPAKSIDLESRWWSGPIPYSGETSAVCARPEHVFLKHVHCGRAEERRKSRCTQQANATSAAQILRMSPPLPTYVHLHDMEKEAK